MNILVTGGSGFLGKHLVKFLIKKDLNVDAPSHAQFDLSNYNKLLYNKNKQYDYIFHLACNTKAGDWCLYHKGEQWETNQDINTSILKYWKNIQPQAKMIAIGTSCSYDSTLALKEENYLKGYPDEGLLTYAFTKRMLYVGLKSYAEQYKLKYNYLIPSTIYGPNFNENDSHFIFDLIKKIYYAKNTGKIISLWGNGEQKRELVYVDDIVNTIYKSIEFENQILNMGCGSEHTIKYYAKVICEYLDYDINKIQWDINKYVGVTSKLLDITKISELITNYKTNLTDLDKGIINTINYYKKLKNENNT